MDAGRHSIESAPDLTARTVARVFLIALALVAATVALAAALA